MKWSPFVKIMIGLGLAIGILAGAGMFVMRYVAQATAPPPRPTFPNDQPAVQVKRSPVATKAALKPSPKPSAAPSPSPSPSPSASLAPGTYAARITQSVGLNLRDAPSSDANRIGGVIFNEQVIVLEESADGGWQRIRVESNGTEGWIKSGNSERTTESANQPGQTPDQAPQNAQ